MPRTTRTITLSLPPEMADQVDKIMEEEGRTRSELLREAIRRYIEEREWRRVFRYGEQVAREQGIGPQDVELTVDQYRDEEQAAGYESCPGY